MAFDQLNYTMCDVAALTQPGDLTKTYTTAELVKQYSPGQYAFVWDKLWGYRIFKLVKNMHGSTLAAGNLVSCVAAASVGTVTAGTTTSVTSSSMTANDMEYQMITVADDAGGAGAAPEGESSLAIGNSTTVINLDPAYAFSAAVGASDSVYVVYINGVELSASSDERGFGHGSIGVQGVLFGAPADNYWCWALQRGWVIAKNTDALVATQNIRAGTGLIQDASDGGQQLEIGQISVSQFAGTEASFATVFIDVFNTIATTDTP